MNQTFEYIDVKLLIESESAIQMDYSIIGETYAKEKKLTEHNRATYR